MNPRSYRSFWRDTPRSWLVAKVAKTVGHKFRRSARFSRLFTPISYLTYLLLIAGSNRAREAADDLKNGRPSTSETPFAEGDDGNGKVGDRVGTLTLGNATRR
ncbi:unnamed protein product [Lasius platythorax]|uniref:Uncharacterized protein n=1 Tax=Lasius platythorax TaxID=488582 RepID=A0AAV2N4R7_9HYME